MNRDHEQTAHSGSGQMEPQNGRTVWCHFTIALLGLWLLSSPPAFGQPLGADTWTHLTAGLLLVLFGLLSVNPRRTWAPWGSSVVGIAIIFAPLVFWAPSAASYTNDTLVGALVVALSILVPGMPGMMDMAGADIPPGWTYNPSSWLQRAPMILLAFLGLLISRYLAAYQLRHTGWAWDPFFGDGTVRVLDSEVSKAWPVSDAGLGAATYLLEALSGFMGDRARWRTMPWMVLMFFLLVVPLGVTSIVLMMMQPVMVGTWCTLCLVTAAAMLLMLPIALDEVIAMGQFMAETRRRNEPFWKTFWMGGSLPGDTDRRTPAFTAPLPQQFTGMTWGVTWPWNVVAAATVGVWLLVAPAVLGTSGGLADSHYITGALVMTVAAIALAEPARAARLFNVVLGVWIAVSPFVLSGASRGDVWNAIVAGAALVALSLRRGVVRERYGTWNRWIR